MLAHLLELGLETVSGGRFVRIIIRMTSLVAMVELEIYVSLQTKAVGLSAYELIKGYAKSQRHPIAIKVVKVELKIYVSLRKKMANLMSLVFTKGSDRVSRYLTGLFLVKVDLKVYGLLII